MNRKEPPKTTGGPIKKNEHEDQNSLQRDSSGLTAADLSTLVDELKIHQVELETQNEELRKAEQELAASQAKYADLYDFAPVGYLTFNSRGVIKSVNSSGAEMLGHTKQKLLNKPFSLCVADQDLNYFFSHLERVFQLQEKQTGEILLRRADQSVFPVKIQSAPQLAGSTRAVECLSTVTDISTLKEAAERDREIHEKLKLLNAELDAERARWKGVVEGIADEVWVCDVYGRMSLMNLHAVTAMGLEEFEGKSVNEIIEEVDNLFPDGKPRPPEQAPLLRSLKGEIVHGEEIMRHKKTGVTRHRQFSSAPMRDASGAITGAVAIVRDITAMKRTEKALRESEARLRGFYESGLIGVIYWNMNGTITAANDKFLEMVGYTREDLNSGRIDWSRMTPPEFRQLDERSMEELMATGVNKEPSEKEYIHKNGTRIPILIARAMLDEERFNGVAFVLDITERKKAEAEIKRHVEKLRAANEALTLFNELAMGRELRIMELKQEVNELCARAGLPPVYRVDFKV